MKKVNGRTRAKKDGTVLRCPKCNSTEGNRVYHFSWSAITCQNCKEIVYKDEWEIEGL
jgi:ribosomal protein S27E